MVCVEGFGMIRCAPWVALVIGAALILYSAREQGRQSALDALKDQNNDATTAANKADTDYVDCLAAGGLWNFGTSRCVRRSLSTR